MSIWNKLMNKDPVNCAIKYINTVEEFVISQLDIFKTVIYNPHISNYCNLEFSKAVKYGVEEYVSKMKLEIRGSTYKKLELEHQELYLDRYNIIPENHAIYGELVTDVLEEDGDKLDYIMCIPRPFELDQFKNANILRVYPICGLEYIDKGEKDIKVIVVPVDLLPHIGPNFDIFVHNIIYFLSIQVIRTLLVKGKCNDVDNYRIDKFIGFEEINTYINTRKIK